MKVKKKLLLAAAMLGMAATSEVQVVNTAPVIPAEQTAGKKIDAVTNEKKKLHKKTNQFKNLTGEPTYDGWNLRPRKKGSFKQNKRKGF